MSRYFSAIAVASVFVASGCSRDFERVRERMSDVIGKGLELQVWANKHTFEGSEPIFVTCMFSNASEAAITFWQSGFWPNTQIHIFDTQGQPAKPTAEGITKQKLFSPGGERSQNFEVVLKPGKTYILTPIDVKPLFQLQPDGVVFIEVVYEERQQTGWSGKVTSNKVRIETR